MSTLGLSSGDSDPPLLNMCVELSDPWALLGSPDFPRSRVDAKLLEGRDLIGRSE